MNNCSKCGATNSPEASSCGNCGASLRDPAKNPSQMGDQNADVQTMGRLAPIGAGPEKKSFDSTKILAAAIPVVVLLAVLLAGWYFFIRMTPEKAIRNFTEAQAKGDFAAAMNYATAESKALFPSSMQDMIAKSRLSKDTKAPEIEVTDLAITGNTATAMVKEKSSGIQQQVYFKQEGLPGNWKLDIRQQMVEVFRAKSQGDPTALEQIRLFIQSQLNGDQAAIAAWNGVLQEAGSR